MIKHLIIGTRPKTLFASLSPTILGTSFALRHGSFSFLIFTLTLCMALLIQIATNFANDYFDALKGADTVDRIGPLRLTSTGLIKKETMLKITLGIFALCAVCGAFLSYFGGPLIASFCALSLILALLYTAGPFPLAYLGLGDVFVLVFFGPIATCGTYFLQTGEISLILLVAGIVPGALSTAILAVNNLRDVEEDRAALKKTLAVRFGDAFAKKEYLFMLFIAYLAALSLTPHYPFTSLVLLSLPFGINLGKRVFFNQNKHDLNALLAETGKLLFLFSILFSIGIML